MHHGKVVIHLFVFQLRVKIYQVEGSDLFMHWVYPQRYTEAVEATGALTVLE